MNLLSTRTKKSTERNLVKDTSENRESIFSNISVYIVSFCVNSVFCVANVKTEVALLKTDFLIVSEFLAFKGSYKPQLNICLGDNFW